MKGTTGSVYFGTRYLSNRAGIRAGRMVAKYDLIRFIREVGLPGRISPGLVRYPASSKRRSCSRCVNFPLLFTITIRQEFYLTLLAKVTLFFRSEGDTLIVGVGVLYTNLDGETSVGTTESAAVCSRTGVFTRATAVFPRPDLAFVNGDGVNARKSGMECGMRA